MGQNPYINAETPPLPTRSYTLTVHHPERGEVVIPVDAENLPSGHEGHVGSVLSLLLAHGVEVDHSCGGVCACSTCHVYVRQGLETSPAPIEEEEDQLDFAPGVQSNSRLSCQFVPNGSSDVVVEIPAWSRNEVSEDH